ncbi:nitroreductase [Thermoplasmatales archaeon ex4572_165]|nr:MAG: nitroreductase [Thermoplasmatales archaeon ex4572_165]
MEFSDVINNRVSTRSFLQKIVSDEDILYILECAQKAPSWMNKQCWRFIVIKKQNIIKEIAKTNIINRWLKQAPVIIVACADPKQSGYNNEIGYYIVDVAIAFEHLILAATNRDLGTCWIGGFDEKKIKEILEIPPRIKIVAMTPVGHSKEKESIGLKTRKKLIRSTKRKSLQEIIHWDKW